MPKEKFKLPIRPVKPRSTSLSDKLVENGRETNKLTNESNTETNTAKSNVRQTSITLTLSP